MLYIESSAYVLYRLLDVCDYMALFLLLTFTHTHSLKKDSFIKPDDAYWHFDLNYLSILLLFDCELYWNVHANYDSILLHCELYWRLRYHQTILFGKLLKTLTMHCDWKKRSLQALSWIDYHLQCYLYHYPVLPDSLRKHIVRT